MSFAETGLPRGRYDAIALALIVIGLWLVLRLHLLSALFAGLLVYELVHVLAPRLPFVPAKLGRAKLICVALIAVLTILSITALVVAAVAFLRSENGSLSALLGKMAETLDSSRPNLPEWLQGSLPVGDADELRAELAQWLRLHAKDAMAWTGEAGRVIAHVVIGMVIGALVSLREVQAGSASGPLFFALVRSLTRLGDAFRRIVFAQVRISALNAGLTALFLVVVLPLAGIHLPLTKTMIALTFAVGLLPVIGNLISNSVIVVISLGHSLQTAVFALLFLIVIHKLEYFVNARIIGTQIRAAAWELLLAMLVMEAAFGLPGVIAAPVFYAYGKSELQARGLI